MSSTRLPKNAPKPRVKGEGRRRALTVIAIALPVVLLVVAIPSLMQIAENAEAPVAQVPDPTGKQPTEAAAATADGDEYGDSDEYEDGDEYEDEYEDGDEHEDEEEPLELVETVAGGDLAIRLELPRTTALTGMAVRGEVRVANSGEETVHIPAAGEAQPTLTIIVLDSEGAEVRRVVESGLDTLPRNTTALEGGHVTRLPVALVETEDDPLPPGEYSAHVEFDAHPHWKRLGLNVWTAPSGALRSDRVRFTVTE